ncbi:MAG: DNA repair protein RecN, partial [Atopobiaceae bacterium]|nr:DNA repair protein RecN [Atopobiaceae bacterium]
RIDAVHPSIEDYVELESALPRAEHAEALIRAAEEAREAIVGDDSDGSSVIDLLSAAFSSIRTAARLDPSLDSVLETINSALVEAEDAASTLRDYRDSVELDPEEFDRMQARMASYQGLIRSYGPNLASVLERREKAAELVEAASQGNERLKAAQRAYDAAEARLAEAADALDAVRISAAPGLAAAVTEQMSRLEMGSASLEVSIERRPRDSWTEARPSQVELLYRPAAGFTARPLRRIASGGEVSRVMLAAKVVLGRADTVDTLVFDEVDAGVGGATAVALANVIADLARTHQVIVVTHLAQVAVMGERHYVVEKTGGDSPETVIREVEDEQRVREIARMLSGDATDAGLAHAREMLAQAKE